MSTVAEDLILKPGSEAVRDASRELERYVEFLFISSAAHVDIAERVALGASLILV